MPKRPIHVELCLMHSETRVGSLTAVIDSSSSIPAPAAMPVHRNMVVFVGGVNGVGKTTTLSKLRAEVNGSINMNIVPLSLSINAAALRNVRDRHRRT